MFGRADICTFSFIWLFLFRNTTHESCESTCWWKCEIGCFCRTTHHRSCCSCWRNRHKPISWNSYTVFIFLGKNCKLTPLSATLARRASDKSSLVILSSWSIYLTIGCCFSKTSASGEVLRFFLCSNSHMQLGQTGNNKLIFQLFKCTFTDHTFSNLNQKLPRRCQN